jgi:hypothetical protein
MSACRSSSSREGRRKEQLTRGASYDDDIQFDFDVF